MKIIIAPDKFKGSLTSAQVCQVVKEGIQMADEHSEILIFPMADGGDGFADVLKYYTKTATVVCKTVDPLHRPITATYQWNADQKTAIIELAAASGLALLQRSERNVMQTSTLGTGLLINDALSKGAEKIMLGIGGSATNDAGTGILTALGFVLEDADGNVLAPSGENVLLIQKIISPGVLPAVQFEIACDVDNPLYGEQGAAFVYAPQKGADARQVQWLDEGLRHFANMILQQTGYQVGAVKGMGAAGGIAAGLVPFLKAVIRQGTDIIMEASHINHALHGVDLIITGEGKIDTQSKDGKLVSSITAMANRHHIPVIGICGSLQLNKMEIQQLGLLNAYAIMNGSITLQYAVQHAGDLLRVKAGEIMLDFLKTRK